MGSRQVEARPRGLPDSTARSQPATAASSDVRAVPVDPAASATRPAPWSRAARPNAGVGARCAAQRASQRSASPGRPALRYGADAGHDEGREQRALAALASTAPAPPRSGRWPSLRRRRAAPSRRAPRRAAAATRSSRSVAEAPGPLRRSPRAPIELPAPEGHVPDRPAGHVPALARSRGRRSACSPAGIASSQRPAAQSISAGQRGHDVRAMRLLDRVGVDQPLGQCVSSARA